MRRMRFAISIPQFVTDGAFDPAAFRAYLRHAEELGFDGAWTQEQLLGPYPMLGPIETMTYAAACTERIRLGCAVFVAIQFFVAFAKLPETKGLPLEDVLSLWNAKSGDAA